MSTRRYSQFTNAPGKSGAESSQVNTRQSSKRGIHAGANAGKPFADQPTSSHSPDSYPKRRASGYRGRSRGRRGTGSTRPDYEDRDHADGARDPPSEDSRVVDLSEDVVKIGHANVQKEQTGEFSRPNFTETGALFVHSLIQKSEGMKWGGARVDACVDDGCEWLIAFEQQLADDGKFGPIYRGSDKWMKFKYTHNMLKTKLEDIVDKHVVIEQKVMSSVKKRKMDDNQDVAVKKVRFDEEHTKRGTRDGWKEQLENVLRSEYAAKPEVPCFFAVSDRNFGELKFVGGYLYFKFDNQEQARCARDCLASSLSGDLRPDILCGLQELDWGTADQIPSGAYTVPCYRGFLVLWWDPEADWSEEILDDEDDTTQVSEHVRIEEERLSMPSIM